MKTKRSRFVKLWTEEENNVRNKDYKAKQSTSSKSK